jgi:hypothetical protein
MALTDGTFETLKKLVKNQFDLMLKSGKLFVVDYDRDSIWDAYLEAFAEAERQEHRCNCCKAFIRQVGGAVIINADLSVTTVWDVAGVPEHYAPSIKALADYVRSRSIDGLYFHENAQAGTDKNVDKVRNVIWQHFHVQIPRAIQEDKQGTQNKASAKVRESAGMLQRALEEFSLSNVDTVLELIDQNSLYRGAEFKHILDGFRDVREEWGKLPASCSTNFYWLKACSLPEQVARVRNVSIGQLLIDLAAGDDLEKAVGSFERMVGGANYKRPTAIATPRMIEDAKKKLEELGFISALHRRQLDSRDLSAANALFTYRPTSATKDVFAELAGDAPVDVKTLSKVEEVSVLNFVEKVLPKAKGLRVLLERPHLSRFVALTGPTDPEAANLFSWDNSYGWSYTGGVADSIKERVKTAGGRVDGWMRASLSWHNHDDLDLHLTGQGQHVYFSCKHSISLQATLDVDMQAGVGTTRTPVENIDIAQRLPAGEYILKVNNYSARDSSDKGFDLEVEVNGSTATFSSNTSPRDGQSELLTFVVDKNGEVAFAANPKLSSTSSSAEKWGLKTGQWHTVGTVTFSPNYWTRPTTNQHLFFLLKGCRVTTDEKVRPFYNEFLCGALTPHRKVTEMLAGKIDVTAADGEELSGIGFSMTRHSTDDKPAHVFVEVTGAFKRIVKVVF